MTVNNVTMHGGTNNTGMVKNAARRPPWAPELRSAIAALTKQLRHLRAEASPLGARTIDESLPVLAPNAVVQPQACALLTVAGVAATAGSLGVPIVETVNRILQLLGAQQRT
ncbi:hypothetical protein ACFWBF_19980 [Streptomyces sp. NPDC060028]|uniref:hypothetical protein n=1 Tax=Streptomyces sp. NPDC060028 TaxID=3347041 RepID=UPI00368DB5D2